jgi:FeS assembly SUF system regulator
MLRIAKLTDYATGLMARLARAPGRQMSAQAMSQEMDLPLPTVAMLLKRLARAGLVQSFRGADGGYCLARPAAAISIAEVITAIDGPVALTECALGVGRCSLEAGCATRANWQLINRAVQGALESVSLADMAEPAMRKLIFQAPPNSRSRKVWV